MFMKIQIFIPPDVADRARAIATSEHRDIHRQIEKFVIDAVRQYPEVGPPEAAPEEETAINAP
jgi:hypothetical protein